MTQVIEKIGGEYENRTHVHGFAIRCVTTPPTRLEERAGYTSIAEGASGDQALPPRGDYGITNHQILNERV